MAGSPVERTAALGDQVADDLRRQIITQQIPADASLVEARLADQYQVSRGPVRDALRTLAQEGLVETSGRSARVTGLREADVDELFALRAALEQLALATARERDREALQRELRGPLQAMRRAADASDPDGFTRADMQFHSAFGLISGLRRVNDVWTQYQRTIDNLLLVANLGHRDLRPALAKHELLAELVDHDDVEVPLAELREHLDASRRRVRAHFAVPRRDDAQADL